MSTVVAHRTCPRHEVENSLAGIRRAAALGADYVEIDVRRTADGIPVLHHDRTLWRMLRLPIPVRRAPLRVVRWRRLRNGERVPTLAEALAVGDEAGIGFAIDTKDRGAAPATLDAVRAAGLEDRVLLWAQSEEAVRAFVAASTAEVALLRDTFAAADHDRFLDDAVAFGARAISAHPDALSESFVADAASRGLTVYAWFQTPAPAPELLARVDGVVTDWPDEIRAQLDDA